jgi:Rieske Fe-S protein
MVTLSKSQVRAALRAASVEFDPSLNLEQLQALLDDYRAGADIAIAADVAQNAAPVEQEAVEVAAPMQEVVEPAQEEIVTEPVQFDIEAALAEFAAPLQGPPIAVMQRATSAGVRVEANRPMQNGVRRPSAGTLCRAVWDFCGHYADTYGEAPTIRTVKAHAASVDWNTNNASIEFYNWRKFNGISARRA